MIFVFQAIETVVKVKDMLHRHQVCNCLSQTVHMRLVRLDKSRRIFFGEGQNYLQFLLGAVCPQDGVLPVFAAKRPVDALGPYRHRRVCPM